MFSKRPKPRSIASQLVLFFTLAAALLLSCGLGVFYWLVVRNAFEEDNTVLADKISALSADLSKAGGPKVLEEELKRARAGEHAAYWIRVVDAESRTIMETPGMSSLLPASIFPAPSRSTSYHPGLKNYHTVTQLFSLITVTGNGVNPYTIQVAQDRSSDEQFTKEFGALLAVVLAVGLLASALIAITVTRRGLRPLREMADSVARITPTHLSERLTPTGWPRELQPLAAAFDDMLHRLENSFTRLSQFSADLAHELRTPIANLLGEAQVTLTRARGAEEYRDVIESSVTECERLAGIVDNLLFLARAEAADRQIQPSPFDARAAVEKIAAYYQTLAEDKHVTIRCSGGGQIFADPALFDRALNNLVDNALRFTPEGGEIQISIEGKTTHTSVSVSDTGLGIGPEHLPHVFDRFYRADSSRSSHGAGLGLALVKSIVDLHGGSATVQSELNRGTTVVLTFPNQGSARALAC